MSGRRSPRERPPWWPAEESWPPAAPSWRATRGRFVRRMGCLFSLFFVLAVGACSLIFWLVGSLVGLVATPPQFSVWGLPASIVALALGAAILMSVGRTLRRTTAPLGDLMDAAQRVADGDYAARVDERGPREVRALAHTFNTMAQRLQQTDQRRRTLLADVTHELRTPLTVIQGNLEGLLDGVYPLDVTRLRSILDETRLLSRLIDDLRTLALAESGALQLHKEPTDFGALVHDTVASFQAQAHTASVTLGAEVAPNVPWLEIDPARMREVLANLILNALRYTSSGGSVQVRCGVTETSQGEKQVWGAVEDTGTGIPPEDLPHVFDRFYKSRDSGGMGLGLTIVKNLVAAHGGQVEAESRPGQGTTIRFALPLSP